MSNEYRVTWTIDLEADDPEHAARIALAIQRNPDPANTATVFDVTYLRDLETVTVDLDEIDESKGHES